MSQPRRPFACLTVLGALAAAAALAGCSDAPPAATEAAQARDEATGAVQRLSHSLGLTADAVKARVNDAAITASVHRRLAADRALHQVSIDVATDDGLVRLSGRVPDEPTRAHAAELAADIEGVREVDNRLQIRVDS